MSSNLFSYLVLTEQVQVDGSSYEGYFYDFTGDYDVLKLPQ